MDPVTCVGSLAVLRWSGVRFDNRIWAQHQCCPQRAQTVVIKLVDNMT